MVNTNNLRVSVAAAAPRALRGDLLALCIFKDAAEGAAGGPAVELVRRLVEEGDFKGEEGDTLLVHAAATRAHDPAQASDRANDSERAAENATDATEGAGGAADAPDELPGGGASRVLLVGAGEREADSDLFRASLRRAAAAAVRAARGTRAGRVAFVLPDCEDAAGAAGAAAEGACLGFYENDFYQQKEDDERPPLREFVLVSGETGDEVRAAVERGRVVAECANWARALADEPGGSLPPRELARRAAAMADEFGLKIETLDADAVRERGMGGLWGVGKGSDEPPALVVVRYEPAGAAASDDLWAFVGKGITFDTGGISIKPADGMEEMKSDMAGGAAALGALRALAQLKAPCRAVAVVPSAENMPSGRSIKPGDVIRTLDGRTIEVVDTDAEGRLVLVDGISYAKQLGATRVVDLATLTGSIIVALGDHRAGLFSNDDGLARRVERAARRAGEPVWRMPVSDDYKKKIESDIADFKNYGGRPDAVAAALLLSKFADPVPWAHLDIAATAWLEGAQPHAPAGATGAGVRTLIELVCGCASEPE